MFADDLIREGKKLVRRGKKYVRALPPEYQELVGFAAGKIIGDVVNEVYESRTPEEKAMWKAGRPMHHGDLGYVLAKDGRKKRDRFMTSVGKGLMFSDIKDHDEWLYPMKKPTTRKKRSKT